MAGMKAVFTVLAVLSVQLTTILATDQSILSNRSDLADQDNEDSLIRYEPPCQKEEEFLCAARRKRWQHVKNQLLEILKFSNSGNGARSEHNPMDEAERGQLRIYGTPSE